ncbi:EF-P 5-aminopentanol modification-associated protein YfmF [Natribacillus halophilus]|uniref:Predicted Zn-dependent peptidase n=1 Tax=Natribacillus halophilus TaxID=549003 RepID=A0A1G8PRR8_9BACI|nr:pitrilysin family protein [Natribacillus halophilus]SDI95122.1 Predicted Zn-dependent peptidase [Natribacillus halophilus]
MAETEQLDAGGLRVHWQPSNKFKTTTIVLHIKAPLEAETAAARTLLAHVLQAGTADYPSRRKIRHFLDDLYGASFYADVGKKGENHVLTFVMEVASEQYLQNESPLLPKALTFLLSVLQSPNMTESGFSETIIKEEKQALTQRIRNIADDKTRYANIRMLEEMCADEPFGLHPFGSVADMEALGNDELQQAYEQMMASDQFDLFVTGPGSKEEILNVVEPAGEYFKTGERKQAKATPSQPPAEINEVVERQAIQQAKLHLGFRIPYTVDADEYTAVLVTNGIFGAYPHSKLFVNVREKESLAYYAASRYEPYKGILFAMAGIAPEQYEKASEIMQAQLEAIRNGEVTEEELTTTRQMLKNQILEQMDSARGAIEMNYQNVLSNNTRTVDERLHEIEDVDKETVIATAQKIQLDTIYLLTGEEETA